MDDTRATSFGYSSSSPPFVNAVVVLWCRLQFWISCTVFIAGCWPGAIPAALLRRRTFGCLRRATTRFAFHQGVRFANANRFCHALLATATGLRANLLCYPAPAPSCRAILVARPAALSISLLGRTCSWVLYHSIYRVLSYSVWARRHLGFVRAGRICAVDARVARQVRAALCGLALASGHRCGLVRVRISTTHTFSSACCLALPLPCCAVRRTLLLAERFTGGDPALLPCCGAQRNRHELPRTHWHTSLPAGCFRLYRRCIVAISSAFGTCLPVISSYAERCHSLDLVVIISCCLYHTVDLAALWTGRSVFFTATGRFWHAWVLPCCWFGCLFASHEWPEGPCRVTSARRLGEPACVLVCGVACSCSLVVFSCAPAAQLFLAWPPVIRTWWSDW